jgi:hypothetical protein
LHSTNAAFNFCIKKLFADIWEREEVDTTRIYSLQILGDVWKEALIDIVGDERSEWGKTFHECEKDFE